MMHRDLPVIASLFLCALFVNAGCETPIDVFTESELYFSMFGFLDVSADTQWVRVEALQDSLRNGSAELDAVFTMTQLSTGRQVVWKDSLFQYLLDFQAHNMWTTEPILPRESYLLELKRSDGVSSSYTVVMPDSFPRPVINVFPFSLINLPVTGNVCAQGFDMLLFDIDILAALEITYSVPTARGTLRTYKVSYILNAKEAEEGVREVTVAWARDLQQLAALDRDIGMEELLQLQRVELLLASAGPGWPDNALDDETVALPGAVTEVENGFGFVGGVISKRIDIPIGNFRNPSCFN